jgi:hypothetical protein
MGQVQLRRHPRLGGIELVELAEPTVGLVELGSRGLGLPPSLGGLPPPLGSLPLPLGGLLLHPPL